MYIRNLLFVFIFSLSYAMAQTNNISIDRWYQEKNAPGVIVTIKDNNGLAYYAQGLANIETFNSIDSLTTFRLASVSKQFTAMAIWKLIEQNKLNWKTKVKDVLHELPLIANTITIGQLVNHSSGLYDYEDLIPEERTLPVSDQDVLQYISDIDSLYFEPGSEFRYSNTGYCLLALVVERLSQLPYEKSIQTLLFNPLGLKNTSVSPTSNDSIRAYGYHPSNKEYIFADQSITSSTKGDGGIYISSVDYGIWLDNNNPFFTTDFWKALADNKIKVKDNIYYSMGWFVKYDNREKPYIFHSGESTGFHNAVLFDPNANHSLVVFSNRDDLIIASLFKYLSKDFIDIGNDKSLFIWMSGVYANDK